MLKDLNLKNPPIHYQIIPTQYCTRKCPYCISSDSKSSKLDISKLETIFDYILKLNKEKNHSKMVIEFNGGEFTTVNNIIDYFKLFKKYFYDIKDKVQLILTTNIVGPKDVSIYYNILNTVKDFDIWFWVSTHYDYNDDYLQRVYNIADFVIKNKIKINYWFNTIMKKSGPINDLRKEMKEYEKRLNLKYTEEIVKIYFNILYPTSIFIPAKLENGVGTMLEKYSYQNKKRYCNGNVVFITPNIISNFCNERQITYKKLSYNYFKSLFTDVKLCDKNCPDQKFNEELFSIPKSESIFRKGNKNEK